MICLSNEGRGRIQFLSEKHVFSYEAENDLNQKRWSLALNIPLQGEEVLHLLWGKDMRVEGDFFRRLKAGIKNHPQEREYRGILRSYVKQVAYLLRLLDDMRSAKPEYECLGGDKGFCRMRNDKGFSWEGLGSDKLTLLSKFHETHQLSLEASDRGSDGNFRRVKVFLSDASKVRPFSKLLSMDLAVRTCL